MYKERMQKLLFVHYMSSELSAEVSETEGVTVARSFLGVKRIPWLSIGMPFMIRYILLSIEDQGIN